MNSSALATNTRPQYVLGVALLFALFCVGQAAAQTSSNLSGIVTDDAGEPIENARVVVTHVPSGTQKSANTGSTGKFYKSGLRVGGPYSVSVSADNYNGAQTENLFLAAGNASPLRIVLEATSAAMEEIVVSAEPSPLNDLNGGVGSSFSAEDIANTPSGSRDVIRVLLRDPLAQSDGTSGNLSVAGINPRFNGLAIDGSLQQDDFGLGRSTFASIRSPINLDTIESATLVASDYDVAASGFTGGLVNLTIKSGTNELDGTAYYAFQNDSMFGTKYDGKEEFDPGPVDEKEYGFTIGGPIVRDKLFFFGSYDEFESSQTVNFDNVDDARGIEPGFFDALSSLIETNTGYDPGTRPRQASTPTTSERVLAKLDWNINANHRASYTYQSTEETGSSVGSLDFETAWYDLPLELQANTIQLFSDWSDSLATTFRINKKDFERGQVCRAGPGVGSIEIQDLDPSQVPAGSPLDGLFADEITVIGGCDRFRHANEFEDERLQALAKLDYITGDHVITAGVEYEDFSLRNLFISGGARGRFVFFGYDGLVNQQALVSYQNDVSNDLNEAAATWGYDKYSFFLQDKWQISPNFELGFGLRYEKYNQSDKPFFSPEIMTTYGIRSDANLDGRDILLPRASFRWDATDTTTVTGGVGLFSGGDPKVWTSNAFSLPTVFARQFITNPDPTEVPASLLAAVASGTPLPIDLIDEKFDIPSDLKASVRVEQLFNIGGSEDYVATFQYLYTKTKKGFLWENLAQTRLPGISDTGVAPDGRVIYADLEDLDIDNLTMLTNHSGGENHVVSVGLGKKYDNGLQFNLSYAHQDIEMVTGGDSSRGISNWRGIVDVDRNNPSEKKSQFEVEHAIKLSLGYEKDFFGTGNSRTRFDLFAQRLSGDPVNWTFNTSANNALFGRAGQGESPFDNGQLYVPTGPNDPLVVYRTGFDETGFADYVKKHKIGTGIISPYMGSASWNTIVDLRIQQDIPGLPFLGDWVGANNFRVVLNIDNFLNFLNDDWGVFSNGPSFIDNAIVSADLVNVADVNAVGVDAATALFGDSPRTTCQSAGDCVYRFNSFTDRTSNFTSSSGSVYNLRLTLQFDF